MTEEKRKRGRPRKIESFQALKEEMDGVEGNYTVAPLNEYDSDKLNTDADEAVSAYIKSKESEKLIPPAGLSKVATLQWLTEKRNKK